MTGNPGTAQPGPSREPRAQTMPAQRLVNLVVRALLHTPGLSGVVGGRLVTLYVVGRKSKRSFAIPVAYHADGDDLLIGTAAPWLRNLRTGESLAIRFKGRLRRADVRLCERRAEVVVAYAHMSRVNPTFAKFNKIRIAEDGTPNPHDLELAWLGGARVLRLTPG